mgnify:CR=1 FL=1
MADSINYGEYFDLHTSSGETSILYLSVNLSSFLNYEFDLMGAFLA